MFISIKHLAVTIRKALTAYLCVIGFVLILSCDKESEEAVTSVSVKQVSVDMIVGETVQLEATVLPSSAIDKSIVWASSNKAVATITNTGVVTAISEGTSTISASAGGKSGTCIVTVSKSVVVVSSIELNETYLEMIEGQTRVLTAVVNPSDATHKSVKWSSSDASIAMVENGTVTAISKGKAVISATSNDGSGKHASCIVNVKRLVSSIELDKSSITVYIGHTITLLATVDPKDANNTGVTWTSSDPSIVEVSPSGIVTGVSRGNATITATANDGGGANVSCEVEVKQYVTRITLDRPSLAFITGESSSLSVTGVYPNDADDKSYSWFSTDESVATVDAAGLVTAINGGVAIIKAIANDGSGVYASCNVGVAIDLGLSVLWAPCNLCDTGFVSAPEGYGDFYAWAEIQSKKTFDWATYRWCNGSENTLTKYNFDSSYGIVDDKTKLDSEDDAAVVILGGNWRMPTFAEFEELYNNCTIVWTKVNGVNGRRFTSKKEGYTDKSLFFPASGTSGGNGYSQPINIGSVGRYWSSSVYTGYPHTAYTLDFDSRNVGWVYGNYFAGFNIRPVTN